MWLSKFLDLEGDIKDLRSKIKENIFSNITKTKLTPLEFTILESIFNSKEISGYDLILNLNKHFAGTWEAQSGTIYPILSKLKKNGFLNFKNVKSPIGPLKKLYFLTQAGASILKNKVKNNFLDQLKFLENFIIELSSIYIHSFPEELRKDKITEVQNLLKKLSENVIKSIPSTVDFKTFCPECKAELDRKGATYCPYCGVSLFSTGKKQAI
ncbi:MAG: helix-turn-helix transcriptional regulator [Promethearchaeota archaeon]